MENYKKCKFNKIHTGFDYSDDLYKTMCYAEHKGEGHIIGECYKYEGKYNKGCKASGIFMDNYESPSLSHRTRVNFYKVLEAYNIIYLINKKDAEIF